MNKHIEKITYVIIIIVIVAIFIGAYFILDKFLLKDDKNKEYKEQITISEVETVVTENGLLKYDLSNALKNDEQTKNYIYIDKVNNFQIVYSDFNDEELAKKNYNTNLNLIKGKYKDLVEKTNISEDKYSKFEVENNDNYIVILKIGTSYFQVETNKNNKNKLQNIIKSFEK